LETIQTNQGRQKQCEAAGAQPFQKATFLSAIIIFLGSNIC
jgi:hypothetical protein